MSTADFSDLGRIVVIIPTFNELSTLPTIVRRVRSSVPEAHILIADDRPVIDGRVSRCRYPIGWCVVAVVSGPGIDQT